jgi:hypothetical protein
MITELETQLDYAPQLGLSKNELLNILLKTEPYSSNVELQKLYSQQEVDNE